MIEFKNVSKSYKKGIRAVDGLSLTVNDGEIFGFLGPNGAGKSTTIRMLTGILNIDEGQILLDGRDIEKEPIEAKKTFGYVADDPDQFLALKGIEYLNFMADVYNVENRKDKIRELTEKYEIQPAGVPVDKDVAKKKESTSLYSLLVIAGEKLLEIIRGMKGAANKDIKKLTNQINDLVERWK